MFPGINPQQMQQAMKKLGVKQEEINASEVIIKTPEKNLIIRNPQITKMKMMGQESLQIIGDIEEETNYSNEPKSLIISEEDINTVSEQANVSKEEAKIALELTKGDLAEAIIELKK